MARSDADDKCTLVDKKQVAARKDRLSHASLDTAFVLALLAAVCKFGDPRALIKRCIEGLRQFPNHYTPPFNWQKQPMDRLVAVSTLLTGIYFLVKTYVIERDVVDRAHKKYKAHNSTLAVVAHGVGSSLEMFVGCLACCYPKKVIWTKIASLLAINNIASGFVLTPGVFGIKHLTVPGFYLFGVLRSLEILRTLAVDYRNYAQAWTLLQVGTVVRLLGYFVLPYSSVDGDRGDLFTEPSIYSFNILLSGYVTAAFVYPPKFVLASLALFAGWQRIQPPRILMRRRPLHDIADEAG